ncbi:hypothetical protein C8J47_2069 [Sphingomonas sp. PP-F2F-G114-C0414]|uniref:hypothetical protein n=1 Tax=Sphingomonas sp. PP-F2F-G114-C0414 TaxID=2135662 RepID=UPI000F132846|nr:hypothetical protein [Sphingomonas sp. PP-F2F-G114-C0414]RMB34346.1 hypothetical protein C8J47_2069 [Sphingomonas sp. PP-F2F-G114-C0414]
MSPKMLRFIAESCGFVGIAAIVIWLVFGEWLSRLSTEKQVTFWIAMGVIVILLIGGVAKRALHIFHPESDDARELV